MRKLKQNSVVKIKQSEIANQSVVAQGRRIVKMRLMDVPGYRNWRLPYPYMLRRLQLMARVSLRRGWARLPTSLTCKILCKGIDTYYKILGPSTNNKNHRLTTTPNQSACISILTKVKEEENIRCQTLNLQQSPVIPTLYL